MAAFLANFFLRFECTLILRLAGVEPLARDELSEKFVRLFAHLVAREREAWNVAGAFNREGDDIRFVEVCGEHPPAMNTGEVFFQILEPHLGSEIRVLLSVTRTAAEVD